MKKSYLLTILILVVNVCAWAQHNSINRIELTGNSTCDIIPISHKVEAYVYRTAIDLSNVDIQKKKQDFINLMLPSILIAKFEIEKIRLQVEYLMNKSAALTVLEQKLYRKITEEL